MSAALELRRLRYLAAMGETAYVCRRQLPGARQPLRYALRPASPAPAESVAAGAGSDGSRGSNGSNGSNGSDGRVDRGRVDSPGAAAAEAARQALRESLQAAPAERAASPERAGQAAAESRDARQQPRRDAPPQVRFRLAAVLCGGRLWLEELGDDALAREQVQLVAAMSRALHHGVQAQAQAAPQVQQFDWPMHSNPQLDLGSEEALRTLQGFLLRLLREQECSELLCLGEAAAARVATLELPCPQRRLPATRDMLVDGRHKRRAWDQLRG